jgi:cell division protein ZapB
MNTDDQNALLESDLNKLEARVDELVRAVMLLKDENRNLRSQQANLMAERSSLIEKTEMAKSRVEAMITRLRSMESS